MSSVNEYRTLWYDEQTLTTLYRTKMPPQLSLCSRIELCSWSSTDTYSGSSGHKSINTVFCADGTAPNPFGPRNTNTQHQSLDQTLYARYQTVTRNWSHRTDHVCDVSTAAAVMTLKVTQGDWEYTVQYITWVSRFLMAQQHNYAIQCHSRWFTQESTRQKTN